MNRCFVKTLPVNGNHDKLAKRGIVISRSSFFSFFFFLQDELIDEEERSRKFRYSVFVVPLENDRREIACKLNGRIVFRVLKRFNSRLVNQRTGISWMDLVALSDILSQMKIVFSRESIILEDECSSVSLSFSVPSN